MNRRKFIKRALIATPIAGGGLAGYGHLIERHHLEVVPVAISLGLEHPLRVCVLGDIHFDPLFETHYIRSVVELVNGISPDMLLFTGDFLSQSPGRMDDLADLLSGARAPLGIFAILGNHDHWAGANIVTKSLANVKVIALRNESVPLPENKGWFLSGLESYWGGRPNTNSIQATPDDSRHILLVHEPDPFESLDDPRIMLQLSGHTHGGQIRVPGIGALELHSWGRKYQMGLYRRENRLLYVNRGIGTVDHHYRVNCRPEITLLELN